MDELERLLSHFAALRWSLEQVWVGDELGVWMYRFEVLTDDGRAIRTVGITPADAVQKALAAAEPPFARYRRECGWTSAADED